LTENVPSFLVGDAADHQQARERVKPWAAEARRVALCIDLDEVGHQADFSLRQDGSGAVAMLTLALMYGPGGVAVQQLNALAQAVGLSRTGELELVRHLLHATPWLDRIADALMIEQLLRHETVASSDPAGWQGRLLPLHEWQHAARTGRQFIEDLMPWPAGIFNAAQAQWLMCARWNYVAATLRATKPDDHPKPELIQSLQRLRRLGHLVISMLP
jgi:hypothetical protein